MHDVVRVFFFLHALAAGGLCQLAGNQQKGRYDQQDQEYNNADIVSHCVCISFLLLSISDQKAQTSAYTLCSPLRTQAERSL